MAVLDQKIEGYLIALNEADQHEPENQSACPDVAAALAVLKEQRQQLQRQAQEMPIRASNSMWRLNPRPD
jgi:hypothetical protein